ncbi:MAG: BrnT family toxin [Chloroflexi bacterium]|nr:MAG: BrnT family toxin [Chloroflexota bacterium]
MRIEDLLWDEANIAHIARHRVEAYEVEEAIWGDPHVRRGRGEKRYRVYGQTEAGRYLFIVIERVRGTLYYVVTARDMTDRERRLYLQVKKKR